MEDPLQLALQWITYLESHAQKIYGMGRLAAASSREKLAGKILEGKLKDGFTLRDVTRPCWSGLTDRERVAESLEDLVRGSPGFDVNPN